ncbi:MAG: hypothetical protein LBE12_17400 [Planctomycetaceae bacterium]|nr:hypothetical protein [Planctomycetaceae bacterium]
MRHSPLSTIILPLQGFGVLYWLRKALPYANAGYPFRANTFLNSKKNSTEYITKNQIGDYRK